MLASLDASSETTKLFLGKLVSESKNMYDENVIGKDLSAQLMNLVNKKNEMSSNIKNLMQKQM